MKKERLFELGKLTLSEGAKAISHIEVSRAMSRYLCGDWGDCSQVERADNDAALCKGFPLRAVYHTEEGVVCFQTDAARTQTTVYLAGEN